MWQNCHFRHICQLRYNFQLVWVPSLLCALRHWRMWQNFHFRPTGQICHIRQLLWVPFIALCFALLAIVAKLSVLPNLPHSRACVGPLIALCFTSMANVAKLSFSPYWSNLSHSPTSMGPLHCFVHCFVGDCGKIVIFAILAKFVTLANFYGPPSLLLSLGRARNFNTA